MSSKDDEIVSMDYSITSKDNAKKKEEANDRKSSKNKSNGSIGKKQNLFKSPSSSAIKSKQFNDVVSCTLFCAFVGVDTVDRRKGLGYC
jgi:hypothetical protein